MSTGTKKKEPESGKTAGVLTDACVLIDYCKEDARILGLANKHLGKIHIPLPILAEVKDLDVEMCQELGLTIYPTREDQRNAALIKKAGLTWEDRLCLIISKEEGYLLYSNDKGVLKNAKREGIPAKWGLELLIELAAKKVLSTEEALSHAQRMCIRIYDGNQIFEVFKKALAGKVIEISLT